MGWVRITCSVLAVALALGAAPRPAWPHDEVPGGDPRRWVVAANPALAVIRPASDFTLLDTRGRAVRLADLEGRVVLLNFIYASCPAACPLLAGRMAALQVALRGARLLTTEVQLLSVTVDPVRDTAPVLARYAEGFGADPDGWRFLRDVPERLAPVLAAWDEWTRPAGEELEHPARVHLIDRRWRVREIYSLALFDEGQVIADIRALLREASPSRARQGSAARAEGGRMSPDDAREQDPRQERRHRRHPDAGRAPAPAPRRRRPAAAADPDPG